MALQGIRTVVNSAAHLGSQCEIFKLKKGSTFQTHRPQQFHHFRQLYSACTPDQHTLPGVMCHGGKCWNGIRKNLLWVLVLHGLYHPMSEADFCYALPVACCRHCAWPTNVFSTRDYQSPLTCYLHNRLIQQVVNHLPSKMEITFQGNCFFFYKDAVLTLPPRFPVIPPVEVALATLPERSKATAPTWSPPSWSPSSSWSPWPSWSPSS